MIILDPLEEARSYQAIAHVPTDDLFAAMVSRGNGGVRVRSTAAPALSTQFVVSDATRKATSEHSGSLAEIIYPSLDTVINLHDNKHTRGDLFGYRSCCSSDVYPGGYGERSARALAKEETTYQLKGVFPSAVLAYSKLRARVETREGNTTALDTVFAAMWGLPVASLADIPKFDLAGSEHTRMSAMEDRAYHALSAHPNINGGFRVDLASLAPDALGHDVPLNWARIRTSLKAIAAIQIQGDYLMQRTIYNHTLTQSFSVFMDLVLHSQSAYQRPKPWESIFEKIVMSEVGMLDPADLEVINRDIMTRLQNEIIDDPSREIMHNPDHRMARYVQEIAALVSNESNKSYARTIQVIMDYDRERAVVQAFQDGNADVLAESGMVRQFEIPRYKIVRTTINTGMKQENLGRSDLPDVTYHGKERRQLNWEELRAAKLTIPLHVEGILNFAVYLTIARADMRPHAYYLMMLLKPALDADTRRMPLVQKLRNQALYADERVYEIGRKLFGEVFRSTVELLLKNIMDPETRFSQSTKHTIWEYLKSRTHPKRLCPVMGDWQDLLMYIVDQPESWTLYFWARRTIGLLHRNFSSGLFTPIAAGQETDLLMAIKKGVRERAVGWANLYAAEYKTMVDTLTAEAERARQQREQASTSTANPSEADMNPRYIPPHLRQRVHLEAEYDADRTRSSGFTKEQYERMVECQSKAKFFSQLQVYTQERKILVGQSDENIRDMFIEFYQARWFSIQTRLEKAMKRKQVLRIGPYEFYEHPWGDLLDEYPHDVEDVIAMMQLLDPRAWTMSPVILHAKLTKSIKEFWDDILNELRLLIELIDENHEELANEQDDAIAYETGRSVLSATRQVDAIPVEVYSYRAPYNLPSRPITFETGEGSAPKTVTVSADVDTFVDKGISSGEESSDDDDAMQLPDLPEHYTLYAPVRPKEFVPAQYRRALSINEIWTLLGLEAVSAMKKRFALGMSAETDLDAPHLEEIYGRIIYEGDEATVQQRWANRVPNIMRLLGRAQGAVFTDDM